MIRLYFCVPTQKLGNLEYAFSLTFYDKRMMAEFNFPWFQGPAIVHTGSLSHCHDLPGHLNRTELLLMLISSTCAFPTDKSKCCKKKKGLLWCWIYAECISEILTITVMIPLLALVMIFIAKLVQIQCKVNIQKEPHNSLKSVWFWL